MIPANSNERIPSGKPVPLANRVTERIRHYFNQHPEVSREEFLLEALRREVYFREQQDAGNGTRLARREDQESSRWSTIRRRPTAEDIRMHAWLAKRLAALHYERHGLWPKLRRFLLGKRLVRWLGY
jgi:hypothetical protein